MAVPLANPVMAVGVVMLTTVLLVGAAAFTVTLMLVVRKTLLVFTTPVGSVTVPLTVKICSLGEEAS